MDPETSTSRRMEVPPHAETPPPDRSPLATGADEFVSDGVNNGRGAPSMNPGVGTERSEVVVPSPSPMPREATARTPSPWPRRGDEQQPHPVGLAPAVPPPARRTPSNGQRPYTNGHAGNQVDERTTAIDLPVARPREAAAPRRPGSANLRDDMLTRVLALAAVGLVIGGLLGVLAGAIIGPKSTASALVQVAVTPDPGLASISPVINSNTAVEDFTAAEIAWLSGDGLARAVQDRLNLAKEPNLTVARVGLSSVVRFTATAGDPDEALRLTQAAVDVYQKRRADAVRDNVVGSLKSLNATIADVLRDPPPPTSGNGLVNNGDGSDWLGQLYGQRAKLLQLQNSTIAPVPVVEPPTLEKAGTSPLMVGGLLGAVVGALLAVAAVALWRSRTNVVVTTAAAGRLVDTLLHPTVRLDRDWQRRSLSVLRKSDRYAARLLVTQLARKQMLAGHVIAVLGASAQSASRSIATLIAVGAADQAPTVLAMADSRAIDHPLSAGVDGAGLGINAERGTPTTIESLQLLGLSVRPGSEPLGWSSLRRIARGGGHFVVVDLGANPELLRMLPEESETVLVIGLGIDEVPHTEALAASIPAGPSGLTGVVTQLPWYWRGWLHRFGQNG